MKRLFSSSVAALLAAGVVSGATINDGTSTQGLVQIINSINDFEGYTLLTPLSSGVLQAEQVGDASPVLKTAWYHESVTATNAVYTVTADFLPAYTDTPECRGGVIGWLDTVASNGIVLQIVPPGIASSSFRLSCVDFLNVTDDQSHLFNLDGTPADSSSAWSAIGTNYVATDSATFELAFTNATPADRVLVSNATARVQARVWQGAGTNRVQVSETRELLTDLPVPPETRHRVGYFGVWASAWPGNLIGSFDELRVEGGVFMQNVPPNVTLTQPAGGTLYTAPATIPLAATASDTDGTIARVEFYSGTTLLATLPQAPYATSWSNVPAGAYAVHAVAIDNEGAAVSTPPVAVTVNALPTVQVTAPLNGTSMPEPASIQIAATAADPDGTIARVDFYAGTTLLGSDDTSPFGWAWNDVAAGTYSLTAQAIDNHGASSTSSAVTVTVTRQTGDGPAMTVVMVGDTVTVIWGVTGYELQYKTTLVGGTWQVVEGSTNLTQYSMQITGSTAVYFRLVGSGGTPSGPSLSAGLSGSQLVITWPSTATGYRLQARDNLESAAWQDVTTSGNQYSEPVSTAVRRFFRLAQ